MIRLLDWTGKLAGDRRIVAFSEEERDGEWWVVVHCRNRAAADSLFDALWDEGWRTLRRYGRDSLWLERSEDWSAERDPASFGLFGPDRPMD